MVEKILGAQRDFSFGEVDPALKRSDDHPARKAGLRQMVNARILNSRAVQDRPGRSALYPITNSGTRTERFTISPGNVYDIQFAAGRLKIIDSTGTTVGNFTLQGNGAALPWASFADIQKIVYVVHQSLKQIVITFGHAMRPQVVSWDGVSTWSITDYAEQVLAGQKRTWFYRVSPQGITMLPGAQTGSTSLVASAAVFTASHVGTRMRYCNRQMLITAVADSTHATVTIEESLPGHQDIGVGSDPRGFMSIGDVIIGQTSGSKGIITAISNIAIDVQLISTGATTVNPSGALTGGPNGTLVPFQQETVAFINDEVAVGPAGSIVCASVGAIDAPTIGVTIWDEEVMNSLQGYPASCFVDQFRLGFCDFPTVPGGIGWSAINAPTDQYVGPNPGDGMFEIAPGKVRIRHVIPGPEGSEFVLADHAIFYIPISETNPLKPGSVAFKLLSGDGAAQVQPRLAQEAILYVNAGSNSLMAIIATGAYLRPFNTKNLCEFHAHLFNNIQCIASPSADGTFNERYVYVLNGDGTIAVGKYDPETLPSQIVPTIGWGPWSGGATVTWIGAHNADVLFTSTYFGTGLVEILDDTQYLDGAVSVNNLPAAFTPPGGKGPLYLLYAGQSVTLIDQVTRMMGTYQVDANGNIVPQNRGGEDLTVASLVAGQPWTLTVEPFAPDADPGKSVGQRMFKRRVARFAAYVSHSSGFKMSRLFSGPITPATQAANINFGDEMNFTRFPAWNQGDDPTKPPPQREITERTRPLGRSFDPRVAIIKDTPGPLQILEIGMEVTI